ncbi:MAG: hypothetical protein JRJ78_06675 [Deltaproteobacteria bacterium]|nr:hypothetical protein [Deltaproteobacteria bacterium]MBW2015329.1 hypothetical protein [Deltaproteobacteria bacterium]MBW2303093.1 hypothetical protein [Deltaproteobacteria bacterium]
MNWMKSKWILFLLVAVPVFYGCAQETGRVPLIKKEPAGMFRPLIKREVIERQIKTLTQILEKYPVSERSRKICSELLVAYQSMLADSSGESGRQSYEDAARKAFVLLNDLTETLLEESCRKVRSMPELIRRYSQRKKEIFDAFMDGDYQAVIDRSIEMQVEFGDDALTPETGLALAASLAKKGMLEEAVRVGKRVLSELREKPDRVELGAWLVEWQLGMGNRSSAMAAYERLLDDMEGRRMVFKKAQQALLNVAREEEKSRIKETSNNITDKQSPDAGALKQLLRDVDTLIARQEFQRAKILLIREKLRIEEGDPQRHIIDEVFKRVEAAEKDLSGRTSSPGRDKEGEGNGLKMARTLIGEEKYKEALEWLKTLDPSEQQDNPEYSRLKEQAWEGIILRERENAARLFLLARNTSEPSKKRELLLKSRKILNDLVERYPLSPSIKKIRMNIQTVDGELEKLGVKPE